jgi:hypothetical protein
MNKLWLSEYSAYAYIFRNIENTAIGFHNTIRVVPQEYIHDTKGPGYHRQPPHPHDQD